MTDKEFWEQAIDYLFENTSLGKIVQELQETDVSVENKLRKICDSWKTIVKSELSQNLR